MISIIIASVNDGQLTDVKTNIAKTIGVEYEIISFNNGNGEKGLCEVYNNGTKQAKFDLICFMHEDVEIKTKNWGLTIISAFEENCKLGIVGVAGSAYKAISPSGWHNNSDNTERSNLIQNFKFADKQELVHVRNPNNEAHAAVVCVDGVWFCTKKEIARKHQFDEKLFGGFHAYDIDFSLQVYQHYEINVRYDILIRHFSEGNFDESWIKEIMKLHKKWDSYLPLTTMSLNKKEIKGIEKRTFKDFSDKALMNGHRKPELFKILNRKNGIRGFDFRLFIKLSFYLLRK